jgi:hypothetical protein
MAEKTYEVGYGKPPHETRFRPGRSGNPKGRPRGARNFSTAFEKELQARVAITENGKRKKITTREIIAKRLVHNALQGDLRSTVLLLQQVVRFEKSDSASDLFESAQDRETMASILERMRSPPDSNNDASSAVPVGERQTDQEPGSETN